VGPEAAGATRIERADAAHHEREHRPRDPGLGCHHEQADDQHRQQDRGPRPDGGDPRPPRADRRDPLRKVVEGAALVDGPLVGNESCEDPPPPGIRVAADQSDRGEWHDPAVVQVRSDAEQSEPVEVFVQPSDLAPGELVPPPDVADPETLLAHPEGDHRASPVDRGVERRHEGELCRPVRIIALCRRCGSGRAGPQHEEAAPEEQGLVPDEVAA
jgi:hypothetical protein